MELNEGPSLPKLSLIITGTLTGISSKVLTISSTGNGSWLDELTVVVFIISHPLASVIVTE